MTKRVRLAQLKKGAEPAPEPKLAARSSGPHVSVYISPAVQKEFKLLAINTEQRVHELYLRGLDLVLQEHGRPSIAEINAKVSR